MDFNQLNKSYSLKTFNALALMAKWNKNNWRYRKTHTEQDYFLLWPLLVNEMIVLKLEKAKHSFLVVSCKPAISLNLATLLNAS